MDRGKFKLSERFIFAPVHLAQTAPARTEADVIFLTGADAGGIDRRAPRAARSNHIDRNRIRNGLRAGRQQALRMQLKFRVRIRGPAFDAEREAVAGFMQADAHGAWLAVIDCKRGNEGKVVDLQRTRHPALGEGRAGEFYVSRAWKKRLSGKGAMLVKDPFVTR